MGGGDERGYNPSCSGQYTCSGGRFQGLRVSVFRVPTVLEFRV